MFFKNNVSPLSPLHGGSVCLFVGVLEKTVEGEAAALTKAKTLYKSCTNESESSRDANLLIQTIFFSINVDFIKILTFINLFQSCKGKKNTVLKK